MRLATSGRRFGSGRIALLVCLLLGTGSSEVYREDILDLSPSSRLYNPDCVNSLSDTEPGGIGLEGTDITSEIGPQPPAVSLNNLSWSPASTPLSKPSNRSVPDMFWRVGLCELIAY